MSNFLENRHPEWADKHNRWTYTWENYSGEYAKHDRVKLYTANKKKNVESFDEYLHQKVQAETVEAYMERIMTSDPILLFPTAVDSLNGIAYSVEDDTQRDFGDLGDIDDEESTAYKLWHDADRKGTNWLPVMKQMGIKQTVFHRVWGLVDGIKESQFMDEDGEVVSEVTGEASIHIIDPMAVVDWYPNHNPTQVIVKEKADMRNSVFDTEGDRERDTYIVYELDGWTRYIDNEGEPQVIDEGSYSFYRDKERTQRCLPIFSVEIPMPRDVGYLLAIKQNHIFNAKSIRDFSVRNMSFAFLQLRADEAQYQEIMSEIKKGFRVLRIDPDASGDHDYKSPPSDYLTEAGEILENDKSDFAESAFKMYGDSAKQVTATEIIQKSRSGIEAFLSLLVTSLDEFENKCLFLLEQIYFPDEPSRWGKANVTRSQDFTPKDIDEAMEKVSNTIRNSKQVNAMSTFRAVELLNPSWTEEEVQAEVDRINRESGAIELPSNQVGS